MKPGGFIVRATIVAASTLVLDSCGKDKSTDPRPPGPPPTSTTYVGSIEGMQGTSGKLTITLATGTPAPQWGSRADTVGASGTIVFAGGIGRVDLVGNYDDVTRIMVLSGGDYELVAARVDWGLWGTFAGPNGETGVFETLARGSGRDTVTVMLGQYVSNSSNSSGVFNFSIRRASLHGNAVSTTRITPLEGRYVSSSGAIIIEDPSSPSGLPLATGRLGSLGAATGTYTNLEEESGTWFALRQ